MAEVLKFVTWLAGLGIGSFTLVGIAYWIFQQWGTKWLDKRFAQDLEAVKHEHQADLQQLKQKIDAHLDRAVKLHDKEFEVLPEGIACGFEIDVGAFLLTKHD